MKFEEEFKKGEKAELLAMDYFRKRGWCVNDLRASNYYQKKDIDFSVMKNNKTVYFEVKQQNRIAKYNQIVIEMYDYKLNRDGWYFKSETDFYIFVNPVEEIGYIIRANDLKEYIESNNFKSEINNFTNCAVLYLELYQLKNIYEAVKLGG